MTTTGPARPPHPQPAAIPRGPALQDPPAGASPAGAEAAPGRTEPAWSCPACGSTPQVPRPGPPRPSPAAPDRGSLLLDWLARNHQVPGLRVGDIAAATGVSTRRLQSLCKHRFGCTPMRLLAAVRMHHAHQALAAPGPAPATIAEAARIAGINRASRFRAAYRSRYGTDPSSPRPGSTSNRATPPSHLGQQ